MLPARHQGLSLSRITAGSPLDSDSLDVVRRLCDGSAIIVKRQVGHVSGGSQFISTDARASRSLPLLRALAVQCGQLLMEVLHFVARKHVMIDTTTCEIVDGANKVHFLLVRCSELHGNGRSNAANDQS